jgi:hypothetical protein
MSLAQQWPSRVEYLLSGSSASVPNFTFFIPIDIRRVDEQ